MFPAVDGGPSSPSSFHSNSSPKNTEFFRLPSREGFGISSNRFDTHATYTPGVGAYNVTPEYQSALLIESPSVSRKGYKGSFGSKTPKFPPSLDSGIPGPNSYSIEATSLAGSIHATRASSPPRSAAFSPSGKGRVPFPDPQPIPGPNSYYPRDPAISPLLVQKGSSTFLSQSKRDSFIRTSETPSPAAYTPLLSPGKEHAKGDIQWSKSPQIRFRDLGKDNFVPGPQRYFNPELDAKLFSPAKNARSCGSYRGPYIGKQSEHGIVLPTFGTDQDRFKHSFCGRLDLIAEIPGPGAYHDDLSVFSTVKLRSYNAQFNPEIAAASNRATTSTGARHLQPASTTMGNRSNNISQPSSPSRPPTSPTKTHQHRPNTTSRSSNRSALTPSKTASPGHGSFTLSGASSMSPTQQQQNNAPHLHAFGHTYNNPSPPVRHVVRALTTGNNSDFIE